MALNYLVIQKLKYYNIKVCTRVQLNIPQTKLKED